MAIRIFAAMLAICILVSWNSPLRASAGASANRSSIQLIVDHQDVHVVPIIKSGRVYVPFRQMCNALGYPVQSDAESGMITGMINGEPLIFTPHFDEIDYKDMRYFSDIELPIINGQAYFPIWVFGMILQYSVEYNKLTNTVNLIPYGEGQETAIKELVTKYYETFSPRLYTSDNLKRGYMNLDYDFEANQYMSEVPVKLFQVNMDRIVFSSSTEAKLQVTYTEQTDVLNRKDIFLYKVRREHGVWRIADDGSIYTNFELPADLDQKAASILEEHPAEQQAVLADMRTYYNALNMEIPEQVVQYTSPWNIQRSNELTYGDETWEEQLEAGFKYSDATRIASDERVIFLGKKNAVVHAAVRWNETSPDGEKLEDEYPALIYLEYANGHWNYLDEFDLSLTEDRRNEVHYFE
ncbi:stalk domain-containing protein [Paenibacillus albus]|uniref:Copper amine oxidase-like N-terminal domain-containing protein n=1 Tax=Paenibacillus albus TaxID=2495582 RepID=A0A3Q8X5L8_9BACL|nr:stalk domain-containing protein [Paenibacillus albus]AZN41067.1 hypothetical protein EJC50_16380 [Paenibacillus albus]